MIGRKNFYGSGAAWAAHLAADIWTVTATAARHDIEPLSLLTGYLQACARHRRHRPGRAGLDPFLPWTPQGRARRRPASDPRPKVPARNPRQPAKPAHTSPSHDAEGHSVMPSRRHNTISHGFPDYLRRP